jgi:DNA ligase-1
MPENSWHRWKNVMKCVPFEEKRLSKWTPPFIVQPKYDGVRCRAVPSSLSPGDYLLLSSEENVIYGVPHILSELKRLRLNAELDGELYVHGQPFEFIYGVTSRTVNPHPDALQVEYHVFDIINRLPQMRRTILIENLKGLSKFIKVAPFWLCESLDEITRVYDALIEDGYEGIIVRHAEAPYEVKRSTWIMKFKPKQSDSYTILGYEEEISIEGNPKDRLGALICDSGDGNTFNVGTGFTDEQRLNLWDIRSLLPGMTCTIKYQHITPGRKVPRFPVFVSLEPTIIKEGLNNG